MKTQRKPTTPNEARTRQPKRTRASVDEMVTLGGEYLRAVTSGSYDDEDGWSGDLRGFHVFGLD